MNIYYNDCPALVLLIFVFQLAMQRVCVHYRKCFTSRSALKNHLNDLLSRSFANIEHYADVIICGSGCTPTKSDGVLKIECRTIQTYQMCTNEITQCQYNFCGVL